MNFRDLMQKMKDLDEGFEGTDKFTLADPDVDEMGMAKSNAETPLMGDVEGKGQWIIPDEDEEKGQWIIPDEDDPVGECGGMPSMGPMSSMAPKQQDNVTMNVSMNGSGAGGIRDLMSILKNIEQGGSDAEKDMVVGLEQMANAPAEQTAGIDAVTPTGDDLHSKGSEAPKVNGGGNPMQRGVSEGLLDQLNNLYQEVKLR
jgi:hypothetical protein